MIFKSHQVNLDKWSYVNPADGSRWYAEGGACWPETGPDAGLVHEWSSALVHDPRPEFEPTRDPEPALCFICGTRAPGLGYDRICWDNGRLASCRYEWAPRRWKFDRPVNRVLVLFRRDAEHNGIGSALEYDWPTKSVASSPAEIEHARKVLTRLAAL